MYTRCWQPAARAWRSATRCARRKIRKRRRKEYEVNWRRRSQESGDRSQERRDKGGVPPVTTVIWESSPGWASAATQIPLLWVFVVGLFVPEHDSLQDV